MEPGWIARKKKELFCMEKVTRAEGQRRDRYSGGTRQIVMEGLDKRTIRDKIRG